MSSQNYRSSFSAAAGTPDPDRFAQEEFSTCVYVSTQWTSSCSIYFSNFQSLQSGGIFPNFHLKIEMKLHLQWNIAHRIICCKLNVIRKGLRFSPGFLSIGCVHWRCTYFLGRLEGRSVVFTFFWIPSKAKLAVALYHAHLLLCVAMSTGSQTTKSHSWFW